MYRIADERCSQSVLRSVGTKKTLSDMVSDIHDNIIRISLPPFNSTIDKHVICAHLHRMARTIGKNSLSILRQGAGLSIERGKLYETLGSFSQQP